MQIDTSRPDDSISLPTTSSSAEPLAGLLDAFATIRSALDVVSRCPDETERAAVAARAAAQAASSAALAAQRAGEAKSVWAAGTGYGFGDGSESHEAYGPRVLTAAAPLAAALATVEACVAADPSPALAATLEASALVPGLEVLLQGAALQAAVSDGAAVAAALSLIRRLAAHAPLAPLLAALPRQPHSLARLLRRLDQSAAVYLKSVASLGAERVDASALALARDIAATCAACRDGLSALAISAMTPTPRAGAAAFPSADAQREAQYLAVLGDLAFGEAALGGLGANGTPSPDVMLAVASEAATMVNSLPLSFGSSVFVRLDESNVTVWRAVITGPQDTPYANGCFTFSILFPQGYPSSPPSVELLTTGHGSVRFNPNLYECGTVCLSLLGTWSGAPGESWLPGVSTVLQVLVSIQALILVPQPFYNEPGYESDFGAHAEESDEYNANVMANTMTWAIVDALEHPPAGFEDVVRAHFWLRRAEIEATALAQLALLEAKGACASCADQLRSGLARFKELVEGMPVPPAVAALSAAPDAPAVPAVPNE